MWLEVGAVISCCSECMYIPSALVSLVCAGSMIAAIVCKYNYIHVELLRFSSNSYVGVYRRAHVHVGESTSLFSEMDATLRMWKAGPRCQ